MQNNKIKILFILPHLKAGGAERVISFIHNEINKNTFTPHLLVIGYKKDNIYPTINTNVTYLSEKRLRNVPLRVMILVHKIKPDIVFSSMGHINLYLGFLKNLFPKIKFIAREASIYSVMKTFTRHILLPNFILNFLYSSLDLIVFQSLEMKNDFNKNFKISPHKTCIINNPITFSNRSDFIYFNKPLLPYKFITVGSLVKNKGHFRILNIFKLIDFDFKFNIVGDGPMRSEIELKVEKLHLSNSTSFLGLQKDLTKIYKNTDFLIQGSYVEGFPNAVLEALSFGIPCLIFEAPGGHNELIIENFNGMIIKKSDNLTEVINNFVSFNWNRKLISDDAYKRFNSSKILDQYEKIFKIIIKINC